MDVSDVFFFCSGEGGVRGARRAVGCRSFIENPKRGEGLPGERGGGRGAGRVSAKFFFGAEVPTKKFKKITFKAKNPLNSLW